LFICRTNTVFILDFFLVIYNSIFRTLITRELQEWHKQQVSKYKNLTTSSTIESETTNERIPSPSFHQEETDSMIASVLPSSENSRTICSSSFIVTEEPIIIPTIMTTSLLITKTNDNSIHQDHSRLGNESILFFYTLRKTKINRQEFCAGMKVYMVDNRVWQATKKKAQ